MKQLVLPLFLVFAPLGPAPGLISTDAGLPDFGVSSCAINDGEAPCRGCNSERKPIASNPAHLSVPYQFAGRGLADLKNKRGKCDNPAQGSDSDDCVAVACTLEGTLTIKNNSAPGSTGRPLTVHVRRGNPGAPGPGTIIQPGQSEDFTFGDPVAGTPEKIPCGSSVSLEISSWAPSGGNQVPTSRTVTWICTTCDRGKAGNQDPTKEEEEPEPAPVAVPEEH